MLQIVANPELSNSLRRTLIKQRLKSLGTFIGQEIDLVKDERETAQQAISQYHDILRKQFNIEARDAAKMLNQAMKERYEQIQREKRRR